jgi:hypothetical protein
MGIGVLCVCVGLRKWKSVGGLNLKRSNFEL